MREPFGFGDVLALTGATRAQMIHWTNTKVIVPTIQETQGTGTPRLFSFLDLVAIRVTVELANRLRTPVRILLGVVPAVRVAMVTAHRAVWITRDVGGPKEAREGELEFFENVAELGEELAHQAPGTNEAGAVGLLIDLNAIVRFLLANGAAR